ncbi:MAG: GGDEF domain-containing protein, partial [Epsilonproteobacteria bacterium]|nr:GGDEF domain-containing protein [Campylobacterota bacterium]
RDEGIHTGYLLSYKKDDFLQVLQKEFWIHLITANLAALSLLALLYHFLHARLLFERIATTDKLTGVYNRHKFYEVAEIEAGRSRRHGRPFSIIIFDIDHFKKINDRYGHGVGDYLLAAVAALVKKHIRKYDLLFRWSGGEFLILAPETDAQGAYKLAEKIRKLIFGFSFEEVGRVTVSAGVSQFYPETDMSVDETIKRAYAALYQSKREGRNKTNVAL